MVIERRAYTFRPGEIPTFWRAQAEWNLGSTFAPVLSRNLTYLEAIAGPAEQIVHLYAFDSPDDWDRAYAAVYARHPAEYFVRARQWLLAQENALYRPAPVPQLELGDHGARVPQIGDAEAEQILVSESTIQFLPGGLPAYWQAYARYCEEAPDLALDILIGVYFSVIGTLHLVREYRWHLDLADRDDRVSHHRENVHFRQFLEAFRPLVAAHHVSLMRPAPLPSHRSIFELANRG